MSVTVTGNPVENNVAVTVSNDRGPQGLSAYAVAVTNGYSGTEAEWLESLEASVTNGNVNAAIEDDAAATRDALELASGDVPELAAEVLTAGTNVAGPRIDVVGVNGTARLLATDVDELRDIEMPNQSGTMALTSDINAANTLTALEAMNANQQEDARTAVGASLHGADTFTSDVAKLKNLWKKVVAGRDASTEVNVLAVGDSLMGRILGSSVGGFMALQQYCGVRGIGCGGLGQGYHGGPALSGGATQSTTDFARWWPGFVTTVPAAGEAVFNFNGTTPIWANRVKVYYIKESGAGTFKLQSRLTNLSGTGAYADISGHTSIDASNATTTAGVATATLTNGKYDIKVVGLTGTVRIIGAIFEDTNVTGMTLCGITRGSSDMADWDDCPQAVLNVVFGDWQPTVVAFCNTGDFTTEENLDAMFGRLTTANADHDVVICGVFPSQLGAAEAQNVVLKQWCADNRAAWLDPTWFWPDWAALNADGWADDATHPSTSAASFFMNWGWAKLLANLPASIPILPSKLGEGNSVSMLTFGRLGSGGINLSVGLTVTDFTIGGTNAGYFAVTDRSLNTVNGINRHNMSRTSGVVSFIDTNNSGWELQNNGGQCEFRPSAGATTNSRLGTSSRPWGKTFTGGLSTGIASKTTTYAALETDHTILCNATSGAFDVDLPAAASHAGREYVIKKIDASGNAVSIDPNGSELIDGSSTSPTIVTQWGSVTIQSDGTSWFITNRYLT